MNRISYLVFILCLAFLIGCSHNQHLHYTGQEAREIKALTTQEVEGYLNGKGMGLSKVAELNQYPGPKHVLELADELELSSKQKEQTQLLFNKMKEKAINIGETYIAKEQALNQMFESGNVSSSTVDSLLVEIGKIKGTLRAAHVNTHIQMIGILTTEQVKKYDELRGYGNGNSRYHHQKHS
ncbi:hypothetical protein LQ318_08035 [Aliifodinibius salicampi]|uniref:Lipoprotein n=1 Tax=Fodinibius salicampi TaxID=1920655 RepID=A0ABT3PYE1_9BACT|nr:hypothetical protein [Fodinibius salicampi]MCW9712851.1 hypothetical protein [Fodinibius salicampi]